MAQPAAVRPAAGQAEDRPACLHGRRRLVRGDAEAHRLGDIGRRHRRRLDGELPGQRPLALPDRLVPLPDRDQPDDDGEHQQARQRRGEPAELPGAPRGGVPLGPLGAQAGGEKLALDAGQHGAAAVRIGPLPCQRQARTPVQRPGVPAEAVPDGRRIGELPVGAQRLPVLVEPAVQPGPGTDERLVRDLHGVVADDEQSRLCQPVYHRVHAVEVQLGTVHPAAGVLGPFAQGGEPGQELAGDPALVLVESVVCAFRGPRDRAGDSAGGLVLGERENAALPVPPGLQQRMGHQRQRSRLASGVGEHLGHECALHAQAGQAGRPGHGPAEFGVGHRTDQLGRVAERRNQPWVPGTVPVEVGPQREQDRGPRLGGRVEQRLHEARALALVAAGGEDLLELIDRDQHRAGWPAAEMSAVIVHRADAWREQRAVRGSPTAGECGKQTRAQQGGLAASGCPDDGEQAPTRQPRPQLLDEPFATEEPVGVLRLETGQPQVRGPLRTRRVAVLHGGKLRRHRSPAFRPLGRVASACLDVSHHDRQRRQPPPAGRVGQRGDGVPGPPGKLAIPRVAGLPAQLAQVGGEPLDRSRRGVQCTLWPGHESPRLR